MLMDETTLILETQHGNLESFNGLVLAYQETLFNSAVYILGDEELAADVTQDAFISAFRHINSYRDGSFKAWLIRMVINRCYDELRRQKRHPSVPLEKTGAGQDEIDDLPWLADTGLSPEENFEAADLRNTIKHCLDALPADFRTAVVLVDIQGMDYMEAASTVSVPLGTIKSRLARGRLHLRCNLRNFMNCYPTNNKC